MRSSARAAQALAHLGETDPALAVMALWCQHRDAEGRTRTEGNSILYDASFTSLGLAEQVGLAAHHVLHVALQHSDRQAALAERLGAQFDPTLYGLAADGIINETLILAGHGVPRPAVLLTDLLSEVGLPAASASAALTQWDTDRLAMALHADPDRAKKAKAYGQSKAFSQDISSGSPQEAASELSDADWRNQMIRALEVGRRVGSGIGRLGAILADLAAPTVPWEVELRGLLAKAVQDVPQVSHRRPSARWAAGLAQAQMAGAPEPVFEPGRTRDAMRPRIVVGLDTSSSVEPMMLEMFFKETQAISRKMQAEVHLLGFDEEVHTRLRMDGPTPLSPPDMRTGGGTDFRPVMAEAAHMRPSILVMLTDLDGPAGPAPRHPVLWAVPARSAPPAPFGRVLCMDA